ncbi:hypothetical protein RJD24_17290 [Bacillaceae bacterium IKA-2]|nr:hypothetical protein RJD24_17290 [Bacillaceae bacterium IKA-2]
MKKKNRIPFIILIIIHTTLLTYTFYKIKDRKRLFVLLMSNIGFAYLFEYIVLNIFQAYRYKPSIFKNKHLDNTLGAIFSQAIYIPFTGVFISAFQLGWKVKLFFVAYFFAIENLFIKIGVFKTNWWKTVYTAPLLPIFFMISNFWYKHLKRGTPIILHMSLFHILIVINANVLYLLAAFRKLRFGRGSIHSWREHFALAPLYAISSSIITTWSLRKGNWFTTVKVFIFFLVKDWILKKSRLLKLNFSLGYFNMLYHLFMLIIALYFKKLLSTMQKKS